MTDPWWRSAVVYQIYPRSFADTDGDGIGDIKGIRRHLDHLEWLGVDAVWLSPVYRSPMADFGYDVADHTDVDPVFGTLDDLDALVAEAHARGIRVLLDWVSNHTSDRHPWFVASRAGRSSPKRDWYIWRDGGPGGGPPNNWRAAFGGSAWSWDEPTGQWYLHLFLPQQPDLNWSNPEVVEAMHDVLRFWLDRGIDGFRADVVHLIGKDPALPDQPPHLAERDLVGLNDQPGTHVLLRGIRAVLDSYPGDRVMVGEVNLETAAHLAPYYGVGDELHLVFDFSLLRTPWDAAAWAAVVRASQAALVHDAAWPAWVLSNHDQVRHRSRYGGSEARARLAATILLTLRGTPFVYAGEELGLEDAIVPDERRVDPGGRDGCRAPIPWETGPGHGWASPAPWLPWPPDADRRDAATLANDPTSILHLYRRLLRLRRTSPALRAGSWCEIEAPPGVLAYERATDTDRRVVLANFGDEPVAVPFAERWIVDLASDGAGADHESWAGVVDGRQAVILRPAG